MEFSRRSGAANTLEPKNLYLSYFEFEVTSPAIVGLNSLLSSPHLPDEGPSGLLWNFFLAQCSNSLLYGSSAMTKSYISYEKSEMYYKYIDGTLSFII